MYILSIITYMIVRHYIYVVSDYLYDSLWVIRVMFMRISMNNFSMNSEPIQLPETDLKIIVLKSHFKHKVIVMP